MKFCFSRHRVSFCLAVLSAPLVAAGLISAWGFGGDRPEKRLSGSPIEIAEEAAAPQGGKSPGVQNTARLPAQGSADKEPAKEKFDPVAVNGRYFEGWPKPKAAILITGRQDGYIEPCGCTGLDSQKGGLSRRYGLIQQLEREGWDLLAIDVGGQVGRFGKQSEIKFGITADALRTMKYKAVGFGPEDLKLSVGEVAAVVANQDGQDSFFVSANVDLLGLVPQVQIVELGGRKIGITAVLGETYQKEINNPDVVITPAAEAIKQVLPQLKGTNLRILLANATRAESEELARQFPEFSLVVTSDGAEEPPRIPAKIEGTKSRLIEASHKGMYAIVLGLYDDPKTPMRYQRVALDSRFPNTPEMKQLMVNYQAQLQALGWAGLDLRPVPRTGQSTSKFAGQFAGVKSCEECHPTAMKIWAASKHAHATESLVKADPPRQFDPECISCHATGWNPQGFYPYATGFVSLDETPQLAGNTCENCHGPGKAHVEAEKGKNPSRREEERAALRLQQGLAGSNLCVTCHDLDNSVNFKFETYWPKVEHKGKR